MSLQDATYTQESPSDVCKDTVINEVSSGSLKKYEFIYKKHSSQKSEKNITKEEISTYSADQIILMDYPQINSLKLEEIENC